MGKESLIYRKVIPHKFLQVLFLVLAYSCSGSSNETITVSNLTLSITVQGADANNPNGDGSGIITCIASAENAVKYSYRFEMDNLRDTENGTLDHTFTKEGLNTYSVVAYAYSDSGEFITVTESIEVLKSNNAFSTLVFSDEFDVDGAVDTSKWLFETVPPENGNWHNGEKQHYTDRTDNASVADGMLNIIAKKETYTFQGNTKNYTSARLNSKFSFTYGRMDIRAKLPQGEGTWPAIWTLGSSVTTVGWPACGEIDIMEHWGHEPAIISSNMHTIACSGGCPNVGVGKITLEDYATEFHVYSMEWSEDEIRFLLDGEFLYTYKPSPKNNDNWPYTQNQFLILNVAMGGSWFSIDPNFTESAMVIDYVRVYQ